jgi:hypothetical protein
MPVASGDRIDRVSGPEAAAFGTRESAGSRRATTEGRAAMDDVEVVRVATGGAREAPEAWSLAAVRPTEHPLLQRLFELYLYDFSEIEHADVDEEGWFVPSARPWLARYWTEPGKHALLLRVGGKPAGFALSTSRARCREAATGASWAPSSSPAPTAGGGMGPGSRTPSSSVSRARAGAPSAGQHAGAGVLAALDRGVHGGRLY